MNSLSPHQDPAFKPRHRYRMISSSISVTYSDMASAALRKEIFDETALIADASRATDNPTWIFKPFDERSLIARLVTLCNICSILQHSFDADEVSEVVGRAVLFPLRITQRHKPHLDSHMLATPSQVMEAKVGKGNYFCIRHATEAQGPFRLSPHHKRRAGAICSM